MNRLQALISALLFLAPFFILDGLACSMYKITVDGKTMVGCNEDAWRTTSMIWFERSGKYGAAFTGSREIRPGAFTPQSGMNDQGLVFSRLESYYPEQNKVETGLIVKNERNYLSSILHNCATVEEVEEYIQQYNRTVFLDDVFIYVDRSGSYLVVEPYELIFGEDPNYVLSNFCPSITTMDQAKNLDRYRNGVSFLETHLPEASLEYTTALSDTMHVSRRRNGDGTLLTSIWDTDNLLVNLYFYHNFEHTVQFDLRNELAQGDHIINVPELFPPNTQFERLRTYITPFNTPWIRVALVILAGFLLLFSLLFGITLIRRRSTEKRMILVPVSILNISLFFYLFVLATNIYIFYFDAPYQHYHSSLISASSYMPFILLLSFLPILYFTYKFTPAKGQGIWLRALLFSNNLIYIGLLLGFGYWGLFNIFN